MLGNKALILKALGHPKRLEILALLKRGTLCLQDTPGNATGSGSKTVSLLPKALCGPAK